MQLRQHILSPYHYLWALGSAVWYGFPASKLTVIGVTGTKGKSSVSEMLFAIFSAAGHKTAVAGTIRFAIGEESRPNLYKMTLPGRGFIQKFLAEAVAKGATHAVIEITSEATLQHRHRSLALDGLIVTNIQKEHIESHGSFEKYVGAKRAIVEALAHSPKPKRVLVANHDIAETRAFLTTPRVKAIGFSAHDLESVSSTDEQISFSYAGVPFSLQVPGVFNALNALSATKLAEVFGIAKDISARALATIARIPGRVERIEAGQDFAVVVDYAHTPDSLTALYEAFGTRRKICVLGNTGGGRDTWKRPLMGQIAEEHCAEVILANEDPYDEDPRKIMEEMAAGMKKVPQMFLDRREGIRAALALAGPGDAVLISGKGTDPYIMEANGKKTPWSDARVAREELEKLVSM